MVQGFKIRGACSHKSNVQNTTAIQGYEFEIRGYRNCQMEFLLTSWDGGWASLLSWEGPTTSPLTLDRWFSAWFVVGFQGMIPSGAAASWINEIKERQGTKLTLSGFPGAIPRWSWLEVGVGLGWVGWGRYPTFSEGSFLVCLPEAVAFPSTLSEINEYLLILKIQSSSLLAEWMIWQFFSNTWFLQIFQGWHWI